MKIEIQQLEFAGHTDVTTHVELDGQIYRESTGVILTSPNSNNALELEILESIMEHISRIQKNILRKIESKRLTQRINNRRP